MWVTDAAVWLKNAISPVARWSTFVGCAALAFSAAVTTVDVVLRTVFDRPVPLAIELTRVMLVVVLFSAMAYAQLRGEHVRVTALIDKFPTVYRLASIFSGDLIVVSVVAVVSWQSFVYAERLSQQGMRFGVLDLPTWPLCVVIGLFTGLFALAVLVELLESLGAILSRGTRYLVSLVPGVILTSTLLAISTRTGLLQVDVAPVAIGFLSFLLLFALIFLGVHIGGAMGIVALAGTSVVSSPNAALAQIGMTSLSVGSAYIWTVVPLFFLMGFIVFESKLSRDIYQTGYTWLGALPGGLASATVAAGSAFSAVVGDTLSGTVAIGVISLPEMKQYKYDTSLATGAICAGGSLGMLIPPSLGFIIYGLQVEQSIGRLFVAGILPGILLTVLFVLYITIRVRVNPVLGPPGPRTSAWDKIRSLRRGWPVLFLFLLVMGGSGSVTSLRSKLAR